MIIGKNTLNFLNSTNVHNSNTNLNDEKQIQNLIKKYLPKNEESLFINNNDAYIEDLVNFITEFKYKDIEIPSELIYLFEGNPFFITKLNFYLEKKLQNLTNSDSTYFYKDITTMFNIFCISLNCEIFDSYDKYNFDDLSRLFRQMESCLIKLYKDENSHLFDLKFNTYIIVLKSLTQLCIINSTDIKRIESTKIFSELITESLNILKYNIELSNDNLSILNHIQGTLLYYFIDLDSLSLKEETLEENIKSYLYHLERIQDGYLLSKHYNFGNKSFIDNNEDKEFGIYSSNFSIVILDLLSKFEKKNISLEIINEIDSFKKILKFYSENFNYKFEANYTLVNIKEFKNKLLDSLVYEYQKNKPSINQNHNVVINDLIFADKNYDSKTLKIIYHILLYSNNLADFIYLNIGQVLSKTKKLKNDYYEFYKLRILDLVIKHYANVGTHFESKNLLEDILKYVDDNITASHLFSVYSKIYLSIALFYSKDTATIQKAKELYSIYIETNDLYLLEHQYKIINENILKNIAYKYYKELPILNDELNDDNLIKLGKYAIKQYNEKRLVQAKFDMVQGLVEISTELLSNPLTIFEHIQTRIDNLIEKSIFHGLCNVFIVGLEKEKKENSDAGFKNYLIELKNGYAIKFIFPATLENEFLKILKIHKETIIFNTDNILSILKQNDKQLIDPVTDLYNITKLNILIQTLKQEKLGFVEIFIDELPEYNQKYGFEFGNKILKFATDKIKNICKEELGVFKLSGTKIGILVSNKENYQHILDNLQKIEINTDDLNIVLTPYIIYTIDRKSKLLISSSKGVDRAILFGEKKYLNI